MSTAEGVNTLPEMPATATHTSWHAWRVVAGSMLGIALSPGALVFYSFGVFLQPIAASTGWSIAQVTFAITVFTAVLALCVPLIGALIDRFGVRAVLLPSIVLFGLSLMSLWFAHKLWQLYLCFGALAALGAGANSIGYMRAVCSWFDRHRGLAVGLAQSGMGLSVTLVPLAAHWLLKRGDWRFSYLSLGIAAGTVGLAAAALLVREWRPSPSPSAARAPRAPSGVIVALRSPRYWRLLGAFVLLSAAMNSMAVHLVPLIQRGGATNDVAVLGASFFGGAMIVGRVLTGLAVDRYFAPLVAAVVFGAAGGGMLALSGRISDGLALTAAAAIGLSAGADSDLLSYLVSRYFGLRNFAALTSYIFTAYLVAAALCPWLVSLSVEHFTSYRPAAIACALAGAGSALLMLSLGAFPTPSSE